MRHEGDLCFQALRDLAVRNSTLASLTYEASSIGSAGDNAGSKVFLHSQFYCLLFVFFLDERFPVFQRNQRKIENSAQIYRRVSQTAGNVFEVKKASDLQK